MPSAFSCLICSTGTSLTLTAPLSAPRAPVCPHLPLEILSRTLSKCVPKNIWSGFTHRGLSHLWHTQRPSGSAPPCKIQDSLWAFQFFPPTLNCPYPPFAVDAVHCQQPLGCFSILAKNLCLTLSDKIITFTPTLAQRLQTCGTPCAPPPHRAYCIAQFRQNVHPPTLAQRQRRSIHPWGFQCPTPRTSGQAK